MKKSNLVIVLLLIAAVLILAGVGAFVYLKRTPVSLAAESKPTLAQEDLVNLVKPGVVRIVHHFSGDVTFASFDYDGKTDKIFDDHGKPLKLPVDDTLLGTGFIVNSNGYILSNAHVVADNALLVQKAESLAYLGLVGWLSQYSDEDLAKFGITKDNAEAKGKDLYYRILQYILDHNTANVKSELTVLNPSSIKDNLADSIKDGMPATLVGANSNFAFDGKDLGEIKINSTGKLPVIKLGDSTNLSTGNKIYIFGFPANADASGKSLNESTFTQGALSAFKDSIKKDFKLIQTDAKVSPGSSGGPLFNVNGEAVGVITYETDTSSASGDNFAFAIPIQFPKDYLKSNGLLDSATGFADHMTLGIAYENASHCKSALAEFSQAKAGMDPNFSVPKYVTPYESKCQLLLASGKSIDTKFDEFKSSIANNQKIAFGGAILVIVLIVAGIVIVILFKRLGRDEKILSDIHPVDHFQDHMVAPTIPTPVVLPKPEIPPPPKYPNTKV